MHEIKNPDPIVRSFVLFVHTADAVLKLGDAFFYRQAKMSSIKFMVLQVLENHGGSLILSQIAEKTLRKAHGITTLVRRMQKDHLLEAKRDKKDRRYVVVTITDEGRALAKELMSISGRIVDQVMSSVREEDAIHLQEVLRVMNKNTHEVLKEYFRR